MLISICYSSLATVPYSFTDSTNQLVPLEMVSSYETIIPNIDSVNAYIDSLDELGIRQPFCYGIGINSDLNITSVGTWDTLSNGDRLWRYKIICPDSKTINLYFQNFILAENSNISFYNMSRNTLLGPYLNDINRNDSLFSTHLVYGDTLILELFEPVNDFEENSLAIETIVYGFKETDTLSSKRSSVFSNDYCLVDANCEEGDDYCREKYSVAKIISNLNNELFYLGTGALVNNTKLDYKPYLLTAFHLIDLDRTSVLSQTEKDRTKDWNIQFGYIRENCGSGSSLQTYEYSGADFRAGWDLTHSEFALVELQVTPKSGETNFPDVFFSGWDRTGDTPDNVGCLHFPKIPRQDNASYFMKVNFDDEQPTTYQTYWWSVDSWDVGSTGKGSSGSPLYNEDRRIVGQLTGQKHRVDDPLQQMCHPYKESIYGKFSLSWDGGGTSDTRLKDWLDPDNTGVTTLDGIKMPNLQFGWVFPTSSITHYAAYTDMQIGSNSTSSYKVESGAELTLKAGREIKISPCTQIKVGSEFRAYIEEPDCDDIVPLSDKLTDHDPNYCSSYPKLVPPRISTENNFELNEPRLKVAPNPITSVSDIKLTIGDVSNISLTLYDNLGNKRFTYLEGDSIASGTYNYTIDGNKLNSGMYVLVLKVDNQIITKKVMNIK